jgi:Uma2 family endonuclease
MVARPSRDATYEDILALPPHVTGQIVFGVLHAHPRPAPKHAQAATTLGEELGPPFKRGRGGPGGWLILFEPELHLGHRPGVNVVVPDLGGWRRERMPEMPVDKAYFDLAPDWVCEVLSPSTAALDRGDKLKVWRAHDVTHVWFVDPEALTLEILEKDERGYRVLDVFSGSNQVRAVPFDAIELDLGALWAR